MLLVSSGSCLHPIRWSHILSWEWRCSWSSADRRCSNYTWVINNLITYLSASYIRDLTVHHVCVCVCVCEEDPQVTVMRKVLPAHENLMKCVYRWKKGLAVISNKQLIHWLSIASTIAVHEYCKNIWSISYLSYNDMNIHSHMSPETQFTKICIIKNTFLYNDLSHDTNAS